ncbi:hypothetical protein ES703_77640 [subsurface metagenome]
MLFIEGHLMLIGYFLAGIGVGVKQPINNFALDRLRDYLSNILAFYLLVKDVFRLDYH